MDKAVSYEKALLKTTVYFPGNQRCCHYCPMLVKHNEECRVTGETVYRPKQLVGRLCPLEWSGEYDHI